MEEKKAFNAMIKSKQEIIDLVVKNKTIWWCKEMYELCGKQTKVCKIFPGGVDDDIYKMLDRYGSWWYITRNCFDVPGMSME